MSKNYYPNLASQKIEIICIQDPIKINSTNLIDRLTFLARLIEKFPKIPRRKLQLNVQKIILIKV